MAKGQKVKKPHLIESVINDYLNQKKSISDLQDSSDFVLSFKHLDKQQGSDIYKWEKDNMLALALDTMGNYCCRPLKEQFSDKFTVYGGFPKKSNFTHPAHVPMDANWARIHINGLHVIAGHIVKNTFYVVFFDNDHTFYITEKKNT